MSLSDLLTECCARLAAGLYTCTGDELKPFNLGVFNCIPVQVMTSKYSKACLSIKVADILVLPLNIINKFINKLTGL